MHVCDLSVIFCFNRVTFNQVHDEAREYQSWHRCEIITEFYSRTSLPPPFNIPYYILVSCWFVLVRIGRCFKRCCQAVCPQRCRDGQKADGGDGMALNDVGGVQNPLIDESGELI